MIPALTLAARHWKETVLAALLVLTWGLAKEIKVLRANLAARPTVESHATKNEATKTTTGPTKTVEKFVVVPGKCDPVLVERVVMAEPVVVEKLVEIVKDSSSTPACSAVKHGGYQFLVGAGANPARAQDGQMIHVGMGLQNILDLSYGHSLPGQPERHDLRVMTRWGR